MESLPAGWQVSDCPAQLLSVFVFSFHGLTVYKYELKDESCIEVLEGCKNQLKF